MQAQDDENIPEYINKIKVIIKDINVMDNLDLEINDKTFKGTLLQSLPAFWDQFVDSLHHTRIAGGDPAPSLNIVHLMRTLKDEYYYQVGWKDITKEESNVTTTYKTFLTKRVSNKDRSKIYCKCCKKRNHMTDNCQHLSKPKCTNCGRFGHTTETCWHNGSLKRKCKSNKTQSAHDDSNPQNKVKQSNIVEEEVSAVSIALITSKGSLSEKEEETFKFYRELDIDNCVSFSNNELTNPLYIECLPDSGTTSHVFNQQELFTYY